MSWKKIKYLRKGETLEYEHEIVLPEPLANWDVFDYWERERTNSMQGHLMINDVLYDVGAEHGWLSVVLGRFCNVFLIEPTRRFWPNIKQTWEANLNTNPAGFFCGLVGDKGGEKKINYKDWPTESYGELIDKLKYVYLHDNSENLPIKTIDQIARESGITPAALNIDVEGAELYVLRGASGSLANENMKVWVSIHSDLMERYGHARGDIFRFMESFGYEYELLGTDHEEHVYFHR